MLVRVQGSDLPRPGQERVGRLIGLRLARLPEDDLGLPDVEDLSRTVRDPAELFVEAPAFEQVRRDLGEQARFALALFRRDGAALRARSELTDDDSGPEVDGERDPVLRLPERERVERR